MEIMNEKDRKKIIYETRKFGGIGLRRQTLRVHKNGAKFPISKAYIEDELLDPEIEYTLVLIPEVKIADKTSITLTYFHRKKGPNIFYSYPDGVLNEKEKGRLLEVMIQAAKEEFFVHQSYFLSTLNYYFEIPSEWARGNKELIMISVVLDRRINQAIEEIIQAILIDFTSNLKEKKGLFKALYINALDSIPDEEQADIKLISENLKLRIRDFHQKLKLMLYRKMKRFIITVSVDLEKNLDFKHLAQEISGAEFNPERFPGLIMKIEKPTATIILFSTGKIVITDLKNTSETEQVVEKVIKKLDKIGVKLANPKISIQNTK